MNKYLEKIAKDRKDTSGFTASDLGKGYLKGIVAGLATGIGGAVGSKPLLKGLEDNPSIDKPTLKKILKSNKDLNVTFSAHRAMPSGRGRFLQEVVEKRGPSFINDKVRVAVQKELQNKGAMGSIAFSQPLRRNYVHMGQVIPTGAKRIKNLDVALHELGHAKDFNGKSEFLNKVRQSSYGVSAKLHGMGMGALAGGLMLQNDKTKDYAWAAPLATAAPMLRGEAAANYHGYKMLKPHGTSAMKKKFLLGVAGKNMLSYGSGVAASALALHAMNKHFNNEKK